MRRFGLRKGGFARRRFRGGGRNGKPRKPPISVGSKTTILTGPGRENEAQELVLLDIALSDAELTEDTADDLAILERRGDILAKQRRRIERQLKKPLSRKQRSELLDELSSLASELNANTSSIADLTSQQAESQTALAEAMSALADEMAAQRRLVETTQGVDAGTYMRIIADMLSGQFGERITALGHTAGAGSAVRA